MQLPKNLFFGNKKEKKIKIKVKQRLSLLFNDKIINSSIDDICFHFTQ